MGTYFQANTDSGVIQIDDSKKILHLFNKTKLGDYYKVTRNIQYTYEGIRRTSEAYAYIIHPNTRSLYFIANPSAAEAHVFTNSTIIWDWYISDKHVYERVHDSGLGILVANLSKEMADDIDVYEFSLDSINAQGNYGLQCFDENGKIIFNSNQGVLNILDVGMVKSCPSNDLHTIYWADYYGQPFEYPTKEVDYGQKSIAFMATVNCWGGAISDNSTTVRRPIHILTKNRYKTLLASPVSNNDPYPGVTYAKDIINPYIRNYTMYMVIDVTNI